MLNSMTVNSQGTLQDEELIKIIHNNMKSSFPFFLSFIIEHNEEKAGKTIEESAFLSWYGRPALPLLWGINKKIFKN